MFRLLLIIVLFISPKILAQNSLKVKLIDSVNANFSTFVEKDIYNNYYFIDKNTFIKKEKANMNEYQDITLGNLHSVNLSSPLLPVLFFKDFNTVILLDQLSNETQRIIGNNYNLLFEAVGLSRQNTLWFYDGVEKKFGLFNFQENKIKFISTFFPTEIKQYKSTYNYFFWVNDENELFTIDFFGKIKKHIKLDTFENIQIIDENNFITKEDNKLYIYIKNLKHEIEIPKNSFQNFCYKDGILSIFTNYKVFNYKLNLP